MIATLLLKLVPLYMNIGIGVLAGKALSTSRDTIARLIFYIINPLIVLNGVLNTRIDTGILLLPICTFLISVCLCLIFYACAQYLWDDSLKNLLAFSAGTGNTGYFGLPLALMLLNDQGEGIYLMALLGITLYENSLGFYLLAREKHGVRECLLKLATLPTLYAFATALILNYYQVGVPEVFAEFMKHIKGAYTLLGMMLIGLGLAGLSSLKIDFKFICMAFLAKFVAWPLAISGLIALDYHVFNFFNQSLYDALMLLAIVPLAVNMVVIAEVLKSQTEKAAAAVVLSTLFAAIYIPLMVWYFMPNLLVNSL